MYGAALYLEADRGHQASAQVTTRVCVSLISSVAELPFPETGYAGLE